MKSTLLSTLFFLFLLSVQSQTTYTWNGSASSNWNTSSNWTPTGIPGPSDNVTIVSASNTCTLSADQMINNFTLSSGTMDLGGHTITIAGTTAAFNSGTIQNGALDVSGAVTTTFGTGAVTMDCAVNITSAGITIRNTTFQNTVNITKTGTGNDASYGGNIFNGTTVITNAGSGYLLLANSSGDQFNGDATFNNTGDNHLYVAYNGSGNVFNGITRFNSSASANNPIYVSRYAVGTTFNNNIVVSSISGGGVQFCGGNTLATAVLSSGFTLSIGAGGFSAGVLSLRQFTQSGSNPVSIVATGTAQIDLGPYSNFSGVLTVTAPNIYSSNSVFNSNVTFTKTDGTNSNPSSGGNTFNGVLTLNYYSTSGTGYWSFANGAPDIYNGDVYSNNNSLNRIIFGHNSTGNQFNGNLYVTQTGSSICTALTWGYGSGTTMAAGKTIFIGGAGFDAGVFYIQGLTQHGTAAMNLNTTGSSSVYLGTGVSANPSSFGGNINITAPDIYVRGTTFNNPATFTKTGGINNQNNGYQNIFNSTCTINQQSNTGYFMLGYNSNDQFNGDIILTSTGTGGIYLGWGAGNPTLAAGKTILTGAAGFSAGFLTLNTFTQLGTAPINLNFTGTNTTLTFAGNSSVGGNLTVSSPNLYFNGCIFNGTVDAVKTGASDNPGLGGNTFNDISSFTNNGDGYLLFGNGSADIWNADVSFINTGTDRILTSWNSSGNQFNGNIIVANTGMAAGIQFGYSAVSGATLAAGKTIVIGAAGFTNGYLILSRFTQLGSAPVNLTFTGPATYLQVGPSSVIGGDVTVVSPRILLNGATYNGNVTLTKNGYTGEWSTGNNTFNGTTIINQTGAGFFGFASGNPDVYNGDLYLNNNSTERIILGSNSTNNQFNGNIILTQTGSSTGIAFGWSAATTMTMAAGKTISVGAAGFNTGYLQLGRFTQLGNVAMNLPLTGASSLIFGPSSAIGGDVTSTSASLYFNGCEFSGTVTSTKNGPVNDASSGNNIFNGNVVMTNSGAGYLLFGNGNKDQFNAAATFNNFGSSNIFIAYHSNNNVFGGVTTFNNNPTANTGIFVSYYSAGTQFNEDIVVNSTNGQGVQFCNGNTTASATLAAGKTISVGSAGFSAGTLLLKQFTQNGTTVQNLNLTGTGNLTFGPSAVFDGNITSNSASLFFNGAVFNGSINSTKNGSTNDQSLGGNTFNGPATFTNNGAGYLLMTRTYPDSYKDDVDFLQKSTGLIYPNYGQTGNYAGNLNIASPATITFGASSGTAVFNGTGAQNITAVAGTPIPVFTRMIINNTGAGVTLNNTSVNISSALTLTSGLLNTTTTHILTMLNNSTVAAGTALSTSYINGPMRYQKSSSGSTILNFPVGSGGDCRPVKLTVAHSTGALYTYQVQLFNASAAALGYTLPPTVDSVSSVHYYTIGRTDASNNNQPVAGLSGNQTIEIHFGANDLVTDGNAITIVKNTYTAPNAWIDIGAAGGPPYNGGLKLTGSITSTSSPTAFNSFSNFAIGFRKMTILPVTTFDFTGQVKNNSIELMWTTTTELNNSFFTVEKSKDGIHFEAIQNIPTKAPGGNSQSGLQYATLDINPYTGSNYYRLKQTDINGKYSYSKIIVVSFYSAQQDTVYPNPTTGTVYIKGLKTPTTYITWYDTGGRVVTSGMYPVQNGMAKINSNLANGIYILKYTSGNGLWQTQRIIIRK